MTRQLILLELNEINFEFVQTYVNMGKLPVLGSLISEHGISTTISEERYEYLEPWIQWVTAHTGKAFADHKVFRLGDIASLDIPQIWEELESRGLSVGAVSPMNAKHRLKAPAFFVPDPWTSTDITGSSTLRGLYAAIRQAVSDNASAKISPASAMQLLRGALTFAQISNYKRYAGLAARGRRHPWTRALFLDLLLTDVFIKELRRSQANFASLFLNAGAHIQHHYMFSSAAYDGDQRNPDWYLEPDVDPVLEALELYDDIVGEIVGEFPRARLMIATGLHQVPCSRATYYWRLKNHAAFLSSIGVPCSSVEPRMSRDFLVVCADEQQARSAEQRLKAAQSNGVPLFEVDNRGRDLFVMLTYPGEIGQGFRFRIFEEDYSNLPSNVVFVAVKNGEHSGAGYFIDTAEAKDRHPVRFPLSDLPARIFTAFGIDVLPGDQAAA